MKRTPLYEWHKRAGAKLTEFAGWEMPVQYSSIVMEHLAVRNAVGVFDISHMGEIFVEGRAALEFLQKICTNDLSKIGPGQAMYSHMCNPRGGVIDDIFVYCLDASSYLVVVNASTSQKDFDWMMKNKIKNAELRNESDRLGMIAVQGPSSEKVVSKIFKAVPPRLRCVREDFESAQVFLCRTGYTGEDGFEVIAPNEAMRKLLEKVMDAGEEFGITPCGLGARDTLRLESGYLLYGNDVDDDHSPLEAGVSWVVKFKKGDFIGKDALASQLDGGLKRKLTAFKLTGRGIPRHGSKIFCDGKEAGVVTSGTFSPSLNAGIAMGYIPVQLQGKFSIECHNNRVPAEVTNLPFYSKKK